MSSIQKRPYLLSLRFREIADTYTWTDVGDWKGTDDQKRAAAVQRTGFGGGTRIDGTRPISWVGEDWLDGRRRGFVCERFKRR